MLARSAHLFFVALLFASAPALAGNEWRVAESSGSVWILQEGRETRLASVGSVLPNGATLATSPNGRALLVHGEESVVVGPNAMLALVQRGGHTRVVQVSGAAEFEVERQNVQHFSVETPFLAAVVKGTHFAVVVSPEGAQVGVDRGAVQVTAPDSRQLTDLEVGMAAIVTADNPAIGLLAGRPVVFQADDPRLFASPRPFATTAGSAGAPPFAGAPVPFGAPPLTNRPGPTAGATNAGPFSGGGAESGPDADGGSEVAMNGPAGGDGSQGETTSGDQDRGHGNDPDGVDEDNPGQGRGPQND